MRPRAASVYGLRIILPRFLVILDVDSTLIEQEVIDLLAEAAGTGDVVASITASAMNGAIDFEESLRTRVSSLIGLSVSKLDSVRQRVQLTRGATELVAGVHHAGGRICAVSGGFHDILDPLAAGLGLDRWRANCLQVSDGVLTGGLRGPIIDAQAKANALREWAEIYSVPLTRTVAVGDGANDVEMMKLAGLSVAFDAKASVRHQANVVINNRDLSQVLALLGLRG